MTIGTFTNGGETLNHEISESERFQNVYIIGKPGSGKSTLLEQSFLHDVRAGHGCAFLDPHGQSAERLLSLIPRERWYDVIYFDLSDREWPVSFNFLEHVEEDERSRLSDNVLEAFGHYWEIGAQTPQLEQIFYNTVSALLDQKEATLLGISAMLLKDKYRNEVKGHITNPVIKDYWTNDFESIPKKERDVRILSTLNKVGQLTADPVLRNLLCQRNNKINFSTILEEGKIFIANLSQDVVSRRKANLIGSLLLAKFSSAAFQRTGTRPFYLHCDEFHNFGSTAYIDMLAGLRKYHVSLTLANQYLKQTPDELREALLGTVGTLIAMSIGPTDAAMLAPYFRLKPDDLMMENYRAFAITQGHVSRELTTLPIEETPNPKAATAIRRHCRRNYSQRRLLAESQIEKFLATVR